MSVFCSSSAYRTAAEVELCPKWKGLSFKNCDLGENSGRSPNFAEVLFRSLFPLLQGRLSLSEFEEESRETN